MQYFNSGIFKPFNFLFCLTLVSYSALADEAQTYPFRYVFLGSGNSCEGAVTAANALAIGGRAEVTENEKATAQIFSGPAAKKFCQSVLEDSVPTPPALSDGAWLPSGEGLLPDVEKGDDPRCSHMEDGSYATAQILAGACRYSNEGNGD